MLCTFYDLVYILCIVYIYIYIIKNQYDLIMKQSIELWTHYVLASDMHVYLTYAMIMFIL
jgi:hypothetical protein